MTLSRRLTTASAFESLPVAALLLELDGTILAANAEATRITGYALEGARIHVLAPALAGRWKALVRAASAQGRAIEDIPLDTPHGPRVLEMVIAIADVDSRPVVQAIALDITARKVADEAASGLRLESLGVVAGGIAHDFNNLLVGVLAEASAAREHDGVTPAIHDALRRIEAAASRMAQLTRQLLAFSGRAQLVTIPLAPDALVGELRDTLATLVRADVEIAVTTEASDAVVEADPALLRQVVLNLVANASDARAHHITVRTYLSAGSWALEVRDDGAGIDAQTLPRIFEPFFTTKSNRHGLGLSAVHGIVRRLGGEVEVESEAGAGALFRIWLPALADTPPRPRLASDPGMPAMALAGVQVLVADDEPSVRATVRRLLERRGAIVVLANDGNAADAALRAQRFGLVILDVRMPGKSGHEVLVAARALQPGVPVILMSGYTEKTRGQGSEEEADAFLEKPFAASALDATIAEVMR